MYKVFFKDRVIVLTDCINNDLSCDFGAVIKYSNDSELKQFIENFEKNENIRSAFIYWHNEKELFQRFRNMFKNLLAAGGLVWNRKMDSILIMKRLGIFDLPKGKVEKNESFQEAALREVNEECGISEISVTGILATTYHTYRLNKHFILKETRWFEMINNSEENLIPQTEENIESVFWENAGLLSDIAKNTYPSIIEVLKSSENIFRKDTFIN